MIYLDNAATSWPKPPGVLDAIREALEESGGNPGRSGHRLSIRAARIVYGCRENLAAYFNLADPLRLIFTPNATYSINLALKGFLKAGDSVVTTCLEHNAVMRPLRYLEQQGVVVKIAPVSINGTIDENGLAALIDSTTRLVVLTQASNVSGAILAVERLSTLAHQKGARVLVDAAQSAGVIPIDIQKSQIDFLAFTGHKELLGPTGIGGLAVHPDIGAAWLNPLVQGGTGSRSESEYQPEDWPDKFEAGTSNLIGIAGLNAGLKFVREMGPEAVYAHSRRLRSLLWEGLSVIRGVRLYGPADPAKSVAIVSFTLAGKSVSEIGFRLDEDHAILTRVGLHCAPAAHRTLGTFPEGTVRLSPGLFTTIEDIQNTLSAIQEIARS
jgi:cysteine desulfurase/selenocysteine lyase